MPLEKRATIIKRPNKLAKKVPRIEGVTAERLIARADKRVEKVAEDYENWVQDDLKGLRDALKKLTKEAQNPVEHVAAIYKLAADIRDQGAVCGYPLVSEVADILCKFVDGLNELGKKEYELVQTQIAALHTIIGNKMKDADTPVAQVLVHDLKHAVTNLRGEALPDIDAALKEI